MAKGNEKVLNQIQTNWDSIYIPTRVAKIENTEKIFKWINNKKKKTLTIPSIGDDVEQVQLPCPTEQWSHSGRQYDCILES